MQPPAGRTHHVRLFASLLAVLATGCAAAPVPPSSPNTGPASPLPSTTAASLPTTPLVLSTLITRPFNLDKEMLGVRGLARSASGALALFTDGEGATLILLDPTTAKARWEVPITETGEGYIHASGVGFAGENLVVGGQFDSQLAVAGKPTLASPDHGVFVLRFDATGKLLASSAITGKGVAIPGFAVDASGAALVGGAFTRDVNIGPFTLPGTNKGDGILGNLFVARLLPNGATAWATGIVGYAYIDHLADGGAGRVIIGGAYNGTFALAGQRFTAEGATPRGHFIAGLDATGNAQWIQGISAAAMVPLNDGSGDVAVCSATNLEQRKPRLLVIRPDGQARLDRVLDLDGCEDLAPGDAGRLFISGSVNLPVAPDGSQGYELHVVEVDTKATAIGSVTLPFRTAPSTAVALVPDGHGGVFCASSFIDFDNKLGKVIVYHVGR